MNPKQYFKKQKPWLQGGIVGVGVCLLLFVFYIFIYFPTINKIYAEDIAKYGGTPAWTTNIPLYTGHLFPLFSHFIIEGSPLVGAFCKPTEKICISWVAKEFFPEIHPGEECVPLTLEDEEMGELINGCCEQQEMAPKESCRETVEISGFFALVLILFAVYFLIGAGIGWVIARKRRIKR